MDVQHAVPILIDSLEQPAQLIRLQKLRRSPKPGTGPHFLENLLQRVIHEHPSALPVDEIEPTFANLRAVCQELKLQFDGGTKYVDNLLINPDGRICVVECKLWHNPEAIREVVSQILSYASALSVLQYDELTHAVRNSLQQPSSDPIIERVLGPDAMEEDRERFIDGVARSLKARDKLIDLSMRNGMLNFRHSETSARHVRIIDENLEFLVQTLASGESLDIIPLPPVEQIPRDEDTDAFRAALKAAKEIDPEWLAAEDARRAAGNRRRTKDRVAERALRDRVACESAPDDFAMLARFAEAAEELNLINAFQSAYGAKSSIHAEAERQAERSVTLQWIMERVAQLGLQPQQPIEALTRALAALVQAKSLRQKMSEETIAVNAYAAISTASELDKAKTIKATLRYVEKILAVRAPGSVSRYLLQDGCAARLSRSALVGASAEGASS